MLNNDVLSQDVKYLKGVGPMRAKLLGSELDIFTLRDLLYTFPQKYIDRSTVHTINSLHEDMPQVQLVGQILSFEKISSGPHKRLKAVFTDGTGVMDIVWFRGLKYAEENYKVRIPYVVLGKPALFGNHFSMVHPEIEKYDAERLVKQPLRPYYHTTERMKQSGFTSRTMSTLLDNLFSIAPMPAETLSEPILRQQRLLPLADAVRNLHRPASSMELPDAVRRMKFEELFFLQLDILALAEHNKKQTKGFVFKTIGDVFNTFYNDHLPFQLTDAQKRVVREIRSDIRSGRQMNRLLQGDVGSGKTMVALLCCLIAIDNGFQACIMAPTEILAEQHYDTLRRQLSQMNLRVDLLTGSVTGRKRKEVMTAVANGNTNILVGTHALIEPDVLFLNLGLAVIDEQHRFGVKQRAKLWEKNIQPPHVLVMTATPIPRTLAMTVYGDLDVSVIDQLPPGRKPIHTIHYSTGDRERLYNGMRTELRRGHQVYVVFPLIEESEKSDLHNLEVGYEELVKAFPEFRVGKVHGRMKPAEKEAAMQEFIKRETQILISTTVIEVGVNVPNASVMVIQDADRFGLAQLHQLRGRVGRGAEQSYCLLVTHHKLSDNTARRMEIMTETTDGFVIAEEDMKLRGPGDIEGTQQSGIPFKLRVADLIHDSILMSQAREAARKVLETDPTHTLPQNAPIWNRQKELQHNKTNYSDIS